MTLLELFILAVGLSMDAFAVAICLGLGMERYALKKSVVVGLYFGAFQFLMPVIGYYLGMLFADRITAFDHWAAFALLLFLGGKMIFESFKKDEDSDENDMPLRPTHMLPFALATSIDALAVGVSFAFLQVSILPAASLIGVTTFTISAVGVKAGKVFGDKFKSKAELVGGAILVLIGLKILIEHLLS
jgi:putative Mn2+ efflux pump MntP